MFGDKEEFVAALERKLSRAVGALANFQIPRTLYRPISRLTCWLFSISDYEPDIKHRLLNSIFTRLDRTCALPSDFPILSSPADGTIACFGKIQSEDGTLLPVKQSLIPIDKAHRVHSRTALYYVGIYLSPWDNHNVCSPTNWHITARTHHAGLLASVRPDTIRRLDANERVEYAGKWNHGYFSLTMVGALNVGSIHVPDDPHLSTNDKADDKRLRSFAVLPLDIPQFRFHPFAHFSLGSYVLLVFEAPSTFRFCCRRGDAVRKGRNLGYFYQNQRKFTSDKK